MKFKKDYLENYKGFNSISLNLDGRNTIIVGTNGAGKSSILNGIVTGFSHMIEKFSYGVSDIVKLEEDIKK